jgi:cytochrome c-type biogenesis protein CcmH/NrfF
MSQRGAFLSLCVRNAPRALLVLGLALAIPFSALAATPQTSVNDVEGEVMCPICGTLLELAESPQAQRERVLVKRLIAEGKSKAEVKDALVAQYGPAVLALPGGSGFDLSAYLVPAIAFVVAAIALAFGVLRWRRAAKTPGPRDPPGNGPQGEDAERLDADLARYDL